MQYTLIDHTADFGIHVFGNSRKELFINSGHALFDLVSPPGKIKGEKSLKVNVSGDDMIDLMINWLRELLYLWTGGEKLVRRIIHLEIHGSNIEAELSYDEFDPDLHEIRHEIKAITYHQAQVQKSPSCWEARIIFDT